MPRPSHPVFSYPRMQRIDREALPESPIFDPEKDDSGRHTRHVYIGTANVSNRDSSLEIIPRQLQTDPDLLKRIVKSASRIILTIAHDWQRTAPNPFVARVISEIRANMPDDRITINIDNRGEQIWVHCPTCNSLHTYGHLAKVCPACTRDEQ